MRYLWQVALGCTLSFAADFPDTYANLKNEERDLRGVIGHVVSEGEARWQMDERLAVVSIVEK